MSNTVLIIIMVILVLMSSFFSSAETAFSSLNKVKLKAIKDEKNAKKIDRTLYLADNYDTLLSTILIGNNLVNIAATSLATLLFTGLLGDNSDLGATVSTIVMTILVLIFGEVTPKSIAKEKAEPYSIIITPILRFFMILFTPVNIFFKGWNILVTKIFRLEKNNSVTEEELKTYVDEARKGGEIDQNERELIRSSIEFDDISVDEILTPRVDVVAVDKYMKLSEIDKIFAETRYSRLPVYIDDIDNIVGIIHYSVFKDIRERKLKSLRTIIKPVSNVSPDTKISRTLRILQASKVHMAVVVDEFGGTEGIVTLEDVLEELVGEIWDEHDEVEVEIEKVGENEYVVSGSASIASIFEYFNLDNHAEDEDFVTVNGWVMKNTDSIPQVGDTFTADGFKTEVLSVNGKRAEDVKIELIQTEDETDVLS